MLIVTIAVGSFVLATLTFYFFPPANSTNKGELIDAVLLPKDIVVPTQATDEATWHLLSISSADCDLSCQQRLCLLNQIRLVHLRDKDRIAKLWLTIDDEKHPEELTMEPGCGRNLAAANANLTPINLLHELTIKLMPANLLDNLPAVASNQSKESYLYIVDPQANIIMRYPSTTPAKDIAKDLGRLLRLSRRG